MINIRIVDIPALQPTPVSPPPLPRPSSDIGAEHVEHVMYATRDIVAQPDGNVARANERYFREMDVALTEARSGGFGRAGCEVIEYATRPGDPTVSRQSVIACFWWLDIGLNEIP